MDLTRNLIGRINVGDSLVPDRVRFTRGAHKVDTP